MGKYCLPRVYFSYYIIPHTTYHHHTSGCLPFGYMLKAVTVIACSGIGLRPVGSCPLLNTLLNTLIRYRLNLLVHDTRLAAPFRPSHYMILQNASKGRATGLLVEDGISKAERSEILRKQKEERKANRKKGMHASAARGSSGASAANAGLRNRRTSAPAMMPAPSRFTPPSAAEIPPLPPTNEQSLAQGAQPPRSEDNGPGDLKPHDSMQHGNMPDDNMPDDNKPGESRLGDNGPISPPSPPADEGHGEAPLASPPAQVAQVDAPPANEVVPAPPAVRAPPPLMFNPTAVPPPTAPPTAGSGQSQPPRHPSVVFSVNETVEKALAQAKEDATLAGRSAAFWKHRCRDVVVWAASFVLLSYASDHGFEDC